MIHVVIDMCHSCVGFWLQVARLSCFVFSWVWTPRKSLVERTIRSVRTIFKASMLCHKRHTRITKINPFFLSQNRRPTPTAWAWQASDTPRRPSLFTLHEAGESEEKERNTCNLFDSRFKYLKLIWYLILTSLGVFLECSICPKLNDVYQNHAGAKTRGLSAQCRLTTGKPHLHAIPKQFR